MVRSMKVAVIGAGTAGLATAVELQREGHEIVVFERNDKLGGTWAYDPRVESDPLGRDPDREIVSSSMYLSLRTNLPRHIMGFVDYPFVKKDGGDRDRRTFPGHEEVLSFLEDFARDFGLVGLIRFGKEVVRVERVGGESDGWVVEWRGQVKKEMDTDTDTDSGMEVFEAVVVCNGKHTEPKIAEFPEKNRMKMIRITPGFLMGAIFGAYMAQNHNVPDVKTLFTTGVVKRRQDEEIDQKKKKSKKDDDDDDDGRHD